MLLVLPYSLEMTAQNFLLLFGPDASNNGKYVEFIIIGDKGSVCTRNTTIGSQEKANKSAQSTIDASQYSPDLFNIKFDSAKSNGNGIVFINPTWCTYTFKSDFSSVIVDPHRNTNRRELKLCESYPLQLSHESINSNTIPFDQSIIRNAHSNSQSETNRNSTRSFKCTYCNGAGRIEKNDNAPASFGTDRPRQKCNECGKWHDPNVVTHYHQQCRHCGGTGYAK